MENIPARNMNPPEQPEAPRCPSCDAPMMERFYRPGFTPKREWYCDNPICPDCELSPSDRVEKLLEYVEVQQDQCDTYQRRACDAEAEVKRLRDALQDAGNSVKFALHSGQLPAHRAIQNADATIRAALEPKP